MDSGRSLDVSQNSGKTEPSSRRCTSRSIASRVTHSLARVNFLAGNQGQSLGLVNHGERRLSFPYVRRVLWLDSWLVTGDSPRVFLTTEYTETTEKEGSRFRVFGVFCG